MQIVLYSLKTHVALPRPRTVRYQRLTPFVLFSPRGFALYCLPEGPVELILDRTNWRIGQQDINILLLSTVRKDSASL